MNRQETTPGNALAFVGVTKRYGRTTLALDNVTWSIDVGARACLLGPNGAGKSTSIRLLEGAIQPTTGRVCLLGADVRGSNYLEARRRTGIVPQGPGMYPDLKLDEYLVLARRLYGRGDVERVVELLGLGPHRGKMLAQLSGGFQRRVSLAAALLAEPDVLLLDEPTVGLDPVASNDVHRALKQAMEGRTTVLCTHNLAEAEALCSEVIILRDGKVLVHETLAGLRARERPRLRIAARQGPTVILQALERLGVTAELEHPLGPSVVVPVDNPELEAPALLRGLLVDGLDIYLCQPVQPTLEGLFLDLVRSAP